MVTNIKYRKIALLVSAIVCSIWSISCSSINEELPTYADTSIVDIGDFAPKFEIESLGGDTLSISDETSTLLILFSHTCPDCINLMRDLQEWLDSNDATHNIIAISRGGTKEQIASFCEDYGLTFPIAADEAAEIYYRYATMYVPRCYVIDNQGIIRLMICEYSEGDIDKLMNALTDIQHP
jgi:peroxiredoxin